MADQADAIAQETTPFDMQFSVWYRRIFLWGLSLMFLPASVQGYLTMAEDTVGPMPLTQLLITVAIVAVIWAIAAVLVTLAALGLARLAGRGAAPQGFAGRFSRWYRRIFLWGPGLFFFGLTVKGFIETRLEAGWLGVMTPLLIQMTVLAVVWAVLAVLVTLVALGLYRAVSGKKTA